MSKPVIIIENNTNNLTSMIDNKIAKNNYVLGGIFTEFDVMNRNRRIYTAERFIPHLDEMNERIKNLAVYGELDHPDVFDISVKNASHLVTEATYNQSNNRVDGKIRILNSGNGITVRQMVDDNAPIFVSSRACGVTEADGTITLKKLFTYDIVADPGFASAKMTPLNESLGYGNVTNDTNYRIYEITDEQKMNELFNMKNNQISENYVTVAELDNFSKYLNSETTRLINELNNKISSGKSPSEEIEKISEELENNIQAQKAMELYLDNFSTKLNTHSTYVKENTIKITSKVESQNEKLESLEQKYEDLVKYVEYVSEHFSTKTNSYKESLEKISETQNNIIKYAEHVAENVNTSNEFNNYIVDNINNVIVNTNNLDEKLGKSIDYSNYLAETVNKSIEYSNYLAENVQDNIDYNKYLAENLDKNIDYTATIVEKLNGNMIVENVSDEDLIPTPTQFGFDDVINLSIDTKNNNVSVEMDGVVTNVPLNTELSHESDVDSEGTQSIEVPVEVETDTTVSIDNLEPVTMDDFAEVPNEGEGTETEINAETSDIVSDIIDDVTNDVVGDNDVVGLDNTPSEEDNVSPETLDKVLSDDEDELFMVNSSDVTESALSKEIDRAISEAKKQKVSEDKGSHFLTFLSRKEVKDYLNLSESDQMKVKLYINERSYYSAQDVRNLISESLSNENETLESKLVRLIPENLEQKWNNLSESDQANVLAQARLYPNLISESQIESWWETRYLEPKNSNVIITENVTDEIIEKDLVSESKFSNEDKLDESYANAIIEKFNSLR